MRQNMAPQFGAAATVAIDAGQLKITSTSRTVAGTAGRTFADFTLQVEATQLPPFRQ
jgi:hypothetical protein